MINISTLIDELNNIANYVDIIDDGDILTNHQYIQKILDILHQIPAKAGGQNAKLLDSLINGIASKINKANELSDKEVDNLINEIDNLIIEVISDELGNALVSKTIDDTTDLIKIRNRVDYLIKFGKEREIAEAKELVTFQIEDDSSCFTNKIKISYIGIRHAIENQNLELFKFFIESINEHIKYIHNFDNNNGDVKLTLTGVIFCIVLQTIVEAKNNYTLSSNHTAEMLNIMFNVFQDINIDFDSCIIRCKLKFNSNIILEDALSVVINNNKITTTLELLKLYNKDNTKLKINNKTILPEIKSLLQANNFIYHQCCNSNIFKKLFSFNSSINLLKHKLPFREFQELEIAAKLASSESQLPLLDKQQVLPPVKSNIINSIKLFKLPYFKRFDSYKLPQCKTSNSLEELIEHGMYQSLSEANIELYCINNSEFDKEPIGDNSRPYTSTYL
ncbi:hypothetical protein OCHUTO_0311 [Orientia chuto str. Dubai]|uniref:Uncharacterized protein n=1 Tax=Orientia chuto str. Dubai TaxID=1359168 RepID=A0A0F3MQ66_9RICK|nr:hypothetical protein [Candidatus Orientia mediorientalis]KJV56739.1 hypothetical protein OCHUTO_0311 [Orientia chuto str. Dubai]